MNTYFRLPYCFVSISWIWLLLATVPPADAGDRVALVIGNDSYPEAPLDNAVGDAEAVRDMLIRQLGFLESDVVFGEDLNRVAIFEKLEAFKKLAQDAELALVFYAGHGMESLDGKDNFMIPVDADVRRIAESDAALRATGVEVGDILTLTSEATPTGAKVVLMDCCRERPAGRGVRGKEGGGLVRMKDSDIPLGTLVILAAAPERLASDGDRHGPFTQALLEQLPVEGINLMESFFAVSDRVSALTEKSQIPWLKFDGSGRILRESVLVPESGGEDKGKVLTVADRLLLATRERPFVNSLGMEFVPVPGQRGVFLCRTETRVRDFRAFATAEKYRQTGGAHVQTIKKKEGGGYSSSWELDKEATWESPGFEQTEDHPVTCVSWEEARAFCAWLSKHGAEQGLTYRLPTDAEWSAAVGPGKYPWGDAWPAPKGSGNYAGAETDDARPGGSWPKAYDYDDGSWKTAKVGSYAVNRFGFYDLGGNVYEICEDEYRATFNGADALEAYPTLKRETKDGTPYRILRGGSWYGRSEIFLRSTTRYYEHPAEPYDCNGFRCVVEVGGG